MSVVTRGAVKRPRFCNETSSLYWGGAGSVAR